MGNGDAKNWSDVYCAVRRIPDLVISLPRKVRAILVFSFSVLLSLSGMLPHCSLRRLPIELGPIRKAKLGGALMMLVLARRGMYGDVVS